MKMAKLLFSFILLVFFSLGAQSQNNKNQSSQTTTKHEKIITYHLSQIKSQEQLNEVKSELLNFRHVTNVTVGDFNTEETVVLKIFVTEVIATEGDEYFNQVGVKKLLSEKGLEFSQLKIEVLN